MTRYRAPQGKAFRRESTTLREWNGLWCKYIEVDAVRCTVCGAVWRADRSPSHREDCLEAEMREACS